jgi:thiamine-phosphate pyrophosphorylase
VLLTPGDLEPRSVAAFLARLAPLFAVGLPGLLVREERLLDRALVELVGALRGLSGARLPWLALHDRLHLVAPLGASALHIGFRSLPPALARATLAQHIALGLSTHAADDARSWTAADYLFHGPVNATPSKAGRLEPIGVAGLARAVRASPRPVLALGGIRPGDVRALLAAGAHGVAVRGGVLASPEPARALARYLAELPPS